MKRVLLVSDGCLNPELSKAVVDIPEHFDKRGTLLYAKRNVVKSFLLETSGEPPTVVVVKRFKRLLFWQRLVYTFFRSSKAERAYRNAVELRRRGFDTPREIACLEEQSHGLLKYGYYVTLHAPHEAIKERLIDPPEFDKELAKHFALFVAEMHGKGVLHHDLNPTNVLYHLEDGKPEFSLIDINRMTFYPENRPLSLKVCFENLTRFTGRMDLFEYVLRCYIDHRQCGAGQLEEAIRIKKNHDKAWRMRKKILRIFKSR